MRGLLGLSRAIDGLNEFIGRWVAWLIILAVVISAGNAVVRKVFDTSSNSWLEMQWWLFGIVFLLCAPWTLAHNEHIRIDIVNALMPNWLKQTIEVVGHTLFLIPICLVMIYLSWPFFMSSAPYWKDVVAAFGAFGTIPFGDWLGRMWSLGEQSTNAGGLPVWPAKFLVPLGFSLLLIQGLSELIKRIAIIRGDLAETASGGGHHAAAEAEARRLQEALEEEARKRGVA